ncbi:uncharacterized protein EV154DRAFT_314623 [Mucor mucedo]|uniref:uncharacterized protein n=1 Tax=Mucor mucedo TaxID=29922 RepID=UPI0022203899|nr:uncharacterized protein EV154DRAFT_314623 [Mucor mucedo]KAI7888232.1 hypothetical protein EV154DRAFT_314623 [Mucor mucedo]
MIRQQVFDHTLSEILDIMDDQIYQLAEHDLSLDYIVLTGGFIPNYYLFRSIKERFSMQVKEVISPINGAALTLSRGATYSVLLDPYDEATHSPYLPAHLPNNKVLIMNTDEASLSNDSMRNKRRFVTIGIDFGTTFSTASYALTGEDKHTDEPLDIIKWPKNSLNLIAKVPTAIRYHLTDPTIYKCGFEALYISPHEEDEYGDVIRRFKLHLKEDKNEYIVDPLPPGLTPLKVISDYLKYLHSNICSQIQQDSNYTSEGIMQRKFQYCLTVPSKWTNKAKMIMREAFTIAGMISRYDRVDRLVIVSEPEATALYIENRNGEFESGDIIMICEAGAETLNLTTFKKNTFGGVTKPFQEIVTGHEIPFESEMFLESNFKSYIWNLLKAFEYSINYHELNNLAEHFQDTVKPVIFEDDDDDDEEDVFQFPLDLPGAEIESEGFNFNGQTLEIQAKVLRAQVFDPLIEYILSMIEYQLLQVESSKLDYLVLIGIFGQTKYLYRKIKEKFDDVVGEILVPERGERAMVRGAVFYGLASL